jgi:hypothetical protein
VVVAEEEAVADVRHLAGSRLYNETHSKRQLRGEVLAFTFSDLETRRLCWPVAVFQGFVVGDDVVLATLVRRPVAPVALEARPCAGGKQFATVRLNCARWTY